MATISDVAKESGVSIATVSVVLNNIARPVRPETRQRVLNAARRLNYHPNAMAQGLMRRRMNTVGLFYKVVNPAEIVINPYASAILQGALRAAAAAGYNLTFFTEPWRSAAESAPAFRDRRTDGLLVVAPPSESDVMPGLAALGVPLVTISAPSQKYGVPSVDVDNAHGARLAIEHLLELGHTRIAHLAGNEDMPSVPVRRGAFLATMAEAGLSAPPEYLACCWYDGHWAYEATRQMLSLASPPTAIFAGNDTMAIAALEAARDAGVSVPERLSIIGFDDVPAAVLVQPSLTTIHQPLTQIGEEATRLLIRRIEGHSIEVCDRLLKPTLAVRGSTAPPHGYQTCSTSDNQKGHILS